MFSAPINNTPSSVRETDDRQEENHRDQSRREAQRTTFAGFLLSQQFKTQERAAAWWGQSSVPQKPLSGQAQTNQTANPFANYGKPLAADGVPTPPASLSAESQTRPATAQETLAQLPATLVASEMTEQAQTPPEKQTNPASSPARGLAHEAGASASMTDAASQLTDPAVRKALERFAGRARTGTESPRPSGTKNQSEGQPLSAGGWMQPSPLMPWTENAPQAPARPSPISMVTMQQLVEFASVGRNQAGDFEFQLGLLPGVLGGLRISVAAYGNRRIGLKIRGADAGKFDAELAALVDELRKRRVDVVEVTTSA